MFTEDRSEELKQEIEFIRAEISYLEVKTVEKFFFEPVRVNGSKASKNKLSNNKRSTFKNNYS